MEGLLAQIPARNVVPPRFQVASWRQISQHQTRAACVLELLGQFQSQADMQGDVYYMFLHPFSMNAIARGHKMVVFPAPRIGFQASASV